MRPDDGAQSVAATAKRVGLNPFMLLMGPDCYSNVERGLSYLHEYIDEEQSYLVLRTPERFLVGVDPRLKGGDCRLKCRSPDVEVRLTLDF
jgi:hypothetical protein